MISFRQADLLEQLQPRDLYIGVDTMEDSDDIIKRPSTREGSLPDRLQYTQHVAEDYYTTPAVFSSSNIDPELHKAIDAAFKSFIPVYIGTQVTGNNAEVEEFLEASNHVLSRFMPSIKAEAERILKSLGKTILKSEVHNPTNEYDGVYVYFQIE